MGLQSVAIADQPTGAKWWSFQPVSDPAPPVVKHAAWVTNPFDAFILARLEAKGLRPNPLAQKRELIRRAYVDLIGLPPPPVEVKRFDADESARAWPKQIDRPVAL